MPERHRQEIEPGSSPAHDAAPRGALLPTTEHLILQLKLKRFYYKKHLGQNFLTNDDILSRIGAACGLNPGDVAVEIGPGAGLLTSKLAQSGARIRAVEFDPRLEPFHRENFAGAPNVDFIYHDALKTDLWSLANSTGMSGKGAGRHVLTGNIPFNITSPLLFGQCSPATPWDRMVLMVQKEVADRVVSPPGKKDYGVLTIKLALWWRVVERFEVPRDEFFPAPRVDAAVLTFEPAARVDPLIRDRWAELSSLIDAAFNQRRKYMVNSLMARWPKCPSREALEATMASMGLDEKVRAERLTPEQFVELFRAIDSARET